jgi:ATP adenylyltransferase
MNPSIPHDTLWQRILAQTEHALGCGALQPIETQQAFVEQEGLRFMVRVAAGLRRKAEDKRQRQADLRERPKDFDPFLPPEPDLTLGPVGDRHIAVLNKFNVVEHHLLIVTRLFEDQEALLNQEDLLALWLCLREFDSLGFYNGGAVAGASQQHKHLQLVPLPMVRDGPSVPLAPGLPMAAEGRLCRIPAFPFAHVFTRLPKGLAEQPNKAAGVTRDYYQRMLAAMDIGTLPSSPQPRQATPYNLLMTRAWMLLVPRSAEFAEGVSINALAYAGSLFVRNAEQLDLVRRLGPLHFLSAVGRPRL